MARKKRLRQRKYLLAISYLLGAAVIILGTIALVAVGKGYSYDPLKGKFTYHGLLILGSVPGGAAIEINGMPNRHRTPYRTTLETGDYTVKVSKDGYRTWTKNLTITASQVTFAQYIFLFPNQINQQAVFKHENMTGLLADKNRRHWAFMTTGSDPGVWLLDLSGQSAVKLYAPKPATEETPPEELVDFSWSDDGSHLLLRSRVDGVDHYILQPASAGAAPLDLTDLFKLEFASLKFNPNNWREMYFLTADGLLRRIDVPAQTISAVLADKVAGFTLDNDRVYYVGSTPVGKALFSLERGGKITELVQSIADSGSYQIAYSGYGGRERIAVLPASTRTVTLYGGFDTPTPTAVVLSKQADSLAFNPDGRILAFYSRDGAAAGSYDQEYAQLYLFNFGGAVAHLTWFDTFHLAVGSKGRAIVIEYDGANRTNLFNLTAGQGFWPAASLRSLIAISQPGTASSTVTAYEIKH